MRVFVIVLVLIFSLQSWTKADDSRDFEIEGMSIGDSLLDYFSVSEIKNFYNYDNLPSNMKFRIAEFYQENYNKMEQYDAMQVYYKPEDKNFKLNFFDTIFAAVDFPVAAPPSHAICIFLSLYFKFST